MKMAAPKPPIRITKQRAEALLGAAGRGYDEAVSDLEDNYGVQFQQDGTLVHDDETFTLLTEEDQAYVMERVEYLTRVRDTMAILRRRYG